ncbi:caspase family protein [Tateyamaria omphalii]|uniref:Caspase family p20 domain-containing protein n=1 Tax=Tateyamaria omphalii TaxID=299262 RepID=A0A1P8N1X1_9RHOB|nr:caspase family protein [Tateyamaria omphalii]APX14314.1 hypothetical protein BWR18_20955 [Tateyamaria omphalii]
MKGDQIMRRVRYIAALILSATMLPQASLGQSAPDRFAFVIGNFGYERRADGEPMKSSNFNLVSPERDVPQYVDVLQNKLGWTILNPAVIDRTSSSMRNDLNKAAAQITAGSEVLFVFNGHGFSQGEANYLVGVPEDGERYTDVGEMVTGSIRLQEVIEVLSQSSPRASY